MDKTTYFWVGLCGICHAGGGPGEYDRDGQLLFNIETETFGYEALGKTAEDVALDGDYAVLNAQGNAVPAPWNVTGLSEPDCLTCHRKDRAVVDGKNMNWIWRTATLRAQTALVDSGGETVPAYAAAATAAQGWFSDFALAETPPGKPPMATTLQIDYSVGVSGGSLTTREDGTLAVSGDAITQTPRDQACWGCHGTPELRKRGRVWFDPEVDVHYRGLNNLDDEDPENDIASTSSTACTYCHESGEDHNIAKGNAFLGSVHNELDYVDFRTCRGCHLEDRPGRDPEAPVPSGMLHTETHLGLLSCETCHIPYKTTEADIVVDNAVTGSTVVYNTAAFLSADPLDPENPDKSRWYPSMKMKTDEDGVERLYPTKLLLSVWWGNLNTGGTPSDPGDDVVEPIPLWRIRQITGNQPLAGVTDDNGDGKPEVNRPEEIALYLAALQGNDSHGVQVATKPVLVKGGRIWYADPDAPGGVDSLSYEETDIVAESSHPFSVNHNVLPAGDALGSSGCATCHGEDGDIVFPPNGASQLFDRKILIDPYGIDGSPIYETVGELTGIGAREDEVSFIRGDGNSDGAVNISDPMYILNFLFSGGAGLPCHAAGDANGDGAVNISDASALLNFLFSDGRPPAAPYPDCGPGQLETDAGLGCLAPPPACTSGG